MRFLDFIEEQKEKHAVFAFGRLNPPTTGHAVLVNKVQEVAKKHNASHHVVLSGSQDNQKNPLTPAQKVKHAKRFFPGTNVSVATKEHPNFLKQAEKLHKSGATHLHMVAGSDRVKEYHEILHKYNGTHKGALFNFKHIKVHSAGERDPDAEGTSGMSASKLRSHASSGNYNEFKKGIPSHVHEKHVKELYNDVRKGMRIKESLDEQFEELLVEGVHDKGIFKAVFLGGGPGSGKDFVLDKTLSGHGLTEINSDKAFEFLMDKNNLDMKMPQSEQEARDVVRGRAKTMTELKQKLALLGRNGVIINGTGDDLEKISKIKERLEQIGYDTSMVMVNTADEVSQQRNIERGQRGGRTVPEKVRKEKWQSVQNARPELAKLFRDNYMEIDNSEDLRTASAEVKQQKESEMMDIYKNVQKFISKPPKSEQAKQWISSELQKKDTIPIVKTGESQPNPESSASQEAQKMGLDYYGFGRYGKQGKVTYRSIHDKLTPVEKLKINEDFENLFNEESDMLSEAVTVSITGDTPEEVNQMFTKMFDKVKKVEQEQFTLSNEDAKDILSLGTKSAVYEPRTDGSTITNVDLARILEKKEDYSGYMKDNNGKVRVFMLRRAAAKEAHQKGGIVYPYKSGGYVIKLNEENKNVSISEKTDFLEERRNSTGGTLLAESSGSSGGTRESAGTSYKITLKEIRERQKTQVEESIDKGIEPGLSMAGAGENSARDMGEKWSKKKKVTVVELAGGGEAMATSIGDQKEDELKKQGINLQSFKAKRPI
jgi:hypothetical protein